MKLLNVLQKAYRALLEGPREAQIARLATELPVLRVREEFPLLLNLKNLRGEGAEIGVQRATFSREILTHWGGQCLYSIDPWRYFGDGEYLDGANVADEDHERNLAIARERMAPFGRRSNLVRKTSLEAAPDFTEGQFDFVYIDGQHHYEAVRDDIAAWWPKVKAGGILAGHDYLDAERNGSRYGVKRAVDEFAAREKLKVVVSLELDFPSWFVFKAK